MRETERLAVWAWLAIAIVVAAGAGGLWWQVRRAGILEARVAWLRNERAAIDDAADRLDAARNRLAGSELRVSSMRQALPRTANLAELFGDVTSRMKQLGFDEPDLTSGSIARYGTHSAVSVEVNFRADGGNALRFVRQIERLPRLIRIAGLHLERDEGDAAVVSADVKLEAFFDPDGGERP